MALDLLVEAHARLRSLPLPPLFRALAQRALDRRIAVKVQLRLGLGENRGEFVTKDFARYGFTDITIRTRRGVNHVHDHPHAIMLAHEMGHHLAWSRGEEHPEYTRIALEAPETIGEWARSSPERAAILLDAEARAWAHGHSELRSLGFDRWDRFRRVSTAAFASYLRHVRGLATF